MGGGNPTCSAPEPAAVSALHSVRAPLKAEGGAPPPPGQAAGGDVVTPWTVEASNTNSNTDPMDDRGE